MTTVPGNWKPHEIEAYQAWRDDDPTCLVRACDRMITSLARGLASRSRRGSDELHSRKEADLKEAGLYEAKQVADFDELYQVGCEAVLKVRDRYNPTKGSFQAFAYKRVRGAMRDALATRQKHLEEGHQVQGQSAAAILNAALREILEGERNDSAFFKALFPRLRGTTLEEWHDIMRGADFEVVRFFWGLLHQRADVVASEIGEDKRKAMLAVTTIWYWQLVFARMEETGTPFRNISGPQHMETIERGRKVYGPLPSKLDDRALGRMFGKDGKTVARWRQDMNEIGTPPLMREDGSFTLKTQEDWEAWMDYWFRIAEPQTWGRLQKRSEREAE